MDRIHVRLVDIDDDQIRAKSLLDNPAVLSALCQFERDLTVQRTNEGLTSARARGRKGGRPPKDAKTMEKALKLYDAKAHSIAEICEICGISSGTLYNALHQRAAAC